MVVVICNGPPGSGKDAICEYLIKEGFGHIEFKKQLFLDAINHYGVDPDWFFSGYTREKKDLPESLLGGISRRESLIHVSENISKKIFGNDYYGKLAANTMNLNVNYCISDGGFVEELSHIINKFSKEDIIMLRLYREGSTYEGDSRKYINCDNQLDTYICGYETDVSELINQSFDISVDLNCVTIHNNGTLYDLYNVIGKIVRKQYERKNRI